MYVHNPAWIHSSVHLVCEDINLVYFDWPSPSVLYCTYFQWILHFASSTPALKIMDEVQMYFSAKQRPPLFSRRSKQHVQHCTALCSMWSMYYVLNPAWIHSSVYLVCHKTALNVLFGKAVAAASLLPEEQARKQRRLLPPPLAWHPCLLLRIRIHHFYCSENGSICL